ncbi:uncharacterized protein LOC107363114 [Tetranychus urticae]|uniref:Mitochondria-eating protein n=1 Tax=Tetranychus urticae TaxID=32264 RepID=T1JRC0_TETUR|nr:uncharacterized protein LOC107363114 [Tetranychus urticae]
MPFPLASVNGANKDYVCFNNNNINSFKSNNKLNSINKSVFLSNNPNLIKQTVPTVDNQRPISGSTNKVSKLVRNDWVTAPVTDVQPMESFGGEYKLTRKEANSSLCTRRIMILHDNLQFDEASKFIEKLSQSTFAKVIKELSIGSLMATFPGSVKILEMIYSRFDTLDQQLQADIPFNELLQPERFVINLVKLFALQKPMKPNGKGSSRLNKNSFPAMREKFDSNHPVIISSKKILKIIMTYQPLTRKDLATRKASLDEALQGLSNHGLVGAVDQSLTSLHDALRLEIISVIDHYKDILLRLENLKEPSNQSKRTAILRSISRATSLTSAARLNSVNNCGGNNGNNINGVQNSVNCNNTLNQKSASLKLEELQDRLIQNQVLLNAVEPITACNQSLQELLLTLQQRINYDKQVLSQFNQLRKEFNTKRPRTSGSNDSVSSILPVLTIFAYGYNQVLNLINEIVPPNETINSDEDSIDSTTKVTEQFESTNKDSNLKSELKPDSGKKQDDKSDNSDYHSGSEPASPNNDHYFTISCHKAEKYDTIIHRSDYRKNRKTISSLFNDKSTTDSLSPSSSSSTSSSVSSPVHSTGTFPASSSTSSSNSSTSSSEPSSPKDASNSVANYGSAQNDYNFLNQQNNHDCLISMNGDVNLLKSKLIEATQMINEMKEREQRLKDRLADQAQKMLSKGFKFENLCFNEKRPTALIRRYGNLYAQARVDTLDALDNLNALKNADDLKAKLLFSLVVLSFCSVEQTLFRMKQQIKKVLKITESAKSQTISAAIDEIDTAVSSYLRVTVDSFDPRNNVEEVLGQICATLYDYPCLRSCDGLLLYIKDCITLAWTLTIQSTPFVIEYGSRTYDKDLHIRFHTSDQSSNTIRSYLWPSLLEGPNGPCVHKGVVIT